MKQFFSGYYRVNYDTKNWELIANYLQDSQNYSKIAPTSRAQIVDDALTLARAGRLDYRIALNLTRYLTNESEYVPWRSALGALSFIDSMMISGPEYYLFKVSATQRVLIVLMTTNSFCVKNYVFSIIKNIYENVTRSSDADDSLLAYKRIDITQFACRLGYEDCVDRSLTKFAEWMNSSDPDQMNK